jgi:enoyl-CoA hydratase/carnithine racemase
MSDRIKIELADGVADVRLNRPEKRNALDGAMFAGILEAAAQLEGERSLRAVVLSGEGPAFCAGLDFSSFAAMAGGAKAKPKVEGSPGGVSLLTRTGDSPANAAQSAAWVWHQLPVPVIAAVHGSALGGGLQLALAADLRIVAPDAQLSVLEIKWGLVPDMTGTQMLRHLVGLDVAKELTFTGRVVSGVEAVELGLATRVSDTPRESAMALAAEIATKSPDAIRADKQLLNAAPLLSVEEGLLLEERLQRSLIGSPNQVEAVKANLRKEAPIFKDPQ